MPLLPKRVKERRTFLSGKNFKEKIKGGIVDSPLSW
jgi:hypothetical protein